MKKLFGSVNLDRGFTARSSQWQRAPRPRFDPLSSIKNELAKASRLNSLPHPPITFKALSPEHSATANQAGLCSVPFSQWLNHLQRQSIHVASCPALRPMQYQLRFDHIIF